MESFDQSRLTRQKERRRQKLLRFVTGEAVALLVLLASMGLSIGQRHVLDAANWVVTGSTILAAIAVVIVPVIVYGPNSTD